MNRNFPILVNAISVAAGLFSLGLWDYNKKENSRRIEEWANANITRIILTPEEELHVTYPGVPSIELRGLNSIKAHGIYENTTETIVIDPLSTRIVGDKSLYSAVVDITAPTSRTDLENTLRHELGHYFLDELAETVGLPQLDEIFEKTRTQQMGYRIVHEGIAEYFEHGSSYDSNFEDADWPDEPLYIFLNPGRYVCRGGFSLVKPIVDEFGEAGMLKLLVEPPSFQDLCDLPGYKSAILDDLRNSSPNTN